MNASTSTRSGPQIDFDIATIQLILTDKPLQILTSKDSSTNTIEEGKKNFVHVVIQSLKDHINSLENQHSDNQKTNLKSCQYSCNYANRNHQEQKLAENVHELPTPTDDIIKEDISTKNNENNLTEKNHTVENNKQSKLDSRGNLLKNDNTPKEKDNQVSNIRTDCGVSPETSTEPCRHTTLFQRRNDVVRHRTTSYVVRLF